MINTVRRGYTYMGCITLKYKVHLRGGNIFMGNNQPNKYRNFMIGAASTALVASAVAPLAASAADFSDVKGNTHESAINALVQAGVINGYADGTFQPNKTLTRSDVVKMMGKWLVSLDYKVPTDYKTNPRFKDLTSKSNDELLKYAALVKDNGVFNGYADGTLGAGLDITRENMAIVLVRAYDAIHKTDLVTLVKETEFDKDVTDLAKAKAEARPYIDVLDYFDITNPVAPQFNPKNTTTRGQFASFLYKTSNVEAAEDTEVPKLVYTGDKTLNVEYGAKFTIPVVTATDNIDKNVKVTSVITNEAGERLTEIDTKESGIYKLTYSAVDVAGNNAEDLVLTVIVAEPAIPEVLSVSAINPIELQVKLNKAVSPESVETSDFKVIATGTNTSVNVSDVKLSNNGKTATILLAKKIPSAGVDVSIDEGALLSKDYDKFVKFSTTAVKAPADKTAPKLLATEFVGGKDIQLTFDEPVDWDTNSPILKIDSATVITNPSVSTEAGNYVYTISAASNLSNGKHAIELRNVTDFAGNRDVLITKEITVDNSAAKVASVRAQDSASFIVEFSKSVSASGINKTNFEIKKDNLVLADNYIQSVSLVDAKGESVQGTSSKFVKVSLQDATTNTANPLYSNDETSINLAVKISGYKDASSVLGTEYSGTVTLSKDTSAPIVKSEKLISSTKTEIVIPFDKTISKVDTGKVTVKQGNVLVSPKVSYSGGNLVLTFSANTLQPGNSYGITLAKGAITALNSKVNEATSFNYTIPVADATYKVPSSIGNVSKDSDDRNVITITYDSKVSDEAGLVGSYLLDGQTLPTGTDVRFVNPDKKVVEIVLPASYKVSTENKAAKLTVAANTVKEVLSGSYISGSKTSATVYEEVITLKDNVAPTIQKAEYVKDSNGYATGLKLTFSENVDTTNYEAIDEFVIKQGSTTIPYLKVVVAPGETATDNVLLLSFANNTNVTAANITLATNQSKKSTLADLNGNVIETITTPITVQ